MDKIFYPVLKIRVPKKYGLLCFVMILSLSFKQQIVFYPDVTTTRLIGMKLPSIPLDVFNTFSYLPVVIELYTPPFFQPYSPPENFSS